MVDPIDRGVVSCRVTADVLGSLANRQVTLLTYLVPCTGWPKSCGSWFGFIAQKDGNKITLLAPKCKVEKKVKERESRGSNELMQSG